MRKGLWATVIRRIHKRVESIVFAVFIKFCDESGLAILIMSSKPIMLIEKFTKYIFEDQTDYS